MSFKSTNASYFLSSILLTGWLLPWTASTTTNSTISKTPNLSSPILRWLRLTWPGSRPHRQWLPSEKMASNTRRKKDNCDEQSLRWLPWIEHSFICKMHSIAFEANRIKKCIDRRKSLFHCTWSDRIITSQLKPHTQVPEINWYGFLKIYNVIKGRKILLMCSITHRRRLWRNDYRRKKGTQWPEISHSTNSLGIGMNPVFALPPIGKL